MFIIADGIAIIMMIKGANELIAHKMATKETMLIIVLIILNDALMI